MEAQFAPNSCNNAYYVSNSSTQVGAVLGNVYFKVRGNGRPIEIEETSSPGYRAQIYVYSYCTGGYITRSVEPVFFGNAKVRFCTTPGTYYYVQFGV